MNRGMLQRAYRQDFRALQDDKPLLLTESGQISALTGRQSSILVVKELVSPTGC